MYKVSSEKNYDFLIFRANGIQMFTASGETDWTQRYVRLNEGINVLEWIYRKDDTFSGATIVPGSITLFSDPTALIK
jgi:hypothetical protein